MNIVVLGDGLLGKELVKQTGWDYISRKKDGFDIEKPHLFNNFFIDNFNGVVFWRKYDVIINCIANTDTYSEDREAMRKINYKAVMDLSRYCENNHIKLVHISTDYVYADSVIDASEEDIPVHPKNWYTYYKLLADEYLLTTNPNALILRSSFKPKPWPYSNGWNNQQGNFDYVDVIAGLMIKVIEKEATGVYNIGTELKTIYQLAKQTNENALGNFKPEHVPEDISINLNKLHKLLNEDTSNNTKS